MAIAISRLRRDVFRMTAYPVYGGILIFMSMASLGLPGMSGFIAELLVLINSYFNLPTFVILALFGIVFTAGYHLWAMQRAVFGTFNEKLGHIHDGADYEMASMGVLILLIIFFGLYPNPVLNMMTASATPLVRDAAGLLGVIV